MSHTDFFPLIHRRLIPDLASSETPRDRTTYQETITQGFLRTYSAFPWEMKPPSLVATIANIKLTPPPVDDRIATNREANWVPIYSS